MDDEVERLLRGAANDARREPLTADDLPSFFHQTRAQVARLVSLEGFPAASVSSGRPTWDPEELRRWRVEHWLDAVDAEWEREHHGGRAPAPSNPVPSHCSFCRREREAVNKLIVGPGPAICDRCVERATAAIDPVAEWRRTVVPQSWFEGSPRAQRDDRITRLQRFWLATEHLHRALLERGFLLSRDLPTALGIEADECEELVERQDFPRPVRTVGDQRVWLQADVERWSRLARMPVARDATSE
jgi:predicted DNA-binding transcriptional regulator AlpA